MYIGDMHGYAMLLLFFSLGFLAQQIQVLVIFLIVSTWRGFFDRLFALERGFFRCSNPKMSMPSWPLGGKAGWRMFHHRVPISNLGHTWTLQGVSNGLPHTTYRLPLGTPWRVLVEVSVFGPGTANPVQTCAGGILLIRLRSAKA